ncbi:MAG: DUF4349 domain-containing protein [Polyangiaceae bacterium]|jgi:uncharacterized protein YdcH (DUF465 family)|nr:DUF4349 domain-containing protein [Polyangiaceae bacterium]MBK8938971.1 DUF4349 domain-containing protein [Polyangiaceae bacterium]
MRHGHPIGLLLLAAFAAGCMSRYSDAAAPSPMKATGGMMAPAESPVREDAGTGATSESDEEYRPDFAKLAPEPPAPPAQPAPAGQKPPVAVGIDDPARKQPILIYRAELNLSVFEVEKSLDSVEGLAKQHGGYLSRRDDRSITVRVPAQHFQELVDAIEKVGDVLHRDVSSEDVTAEYRDLEIQLQNQVALRARFEKLLEKANKVQEALEIEKELGRITGEIERIKGRLKLLGDLARYSTVTVRFEPRASQQVQQGPFVLPLPWLNNVGLGRLKSL